MFWPWRGLQPGLVCGDGFEAFLANAGPGRGSLFLRSSLPLSHSDCSESTVNSSAAYFSTWTDSTSSRKGPGFLSLSMNPSPLIWLGSTGPIP